ncbi:MAG: peptidoglycan DD-metalloendopeptidase family protein [Clostridia bacterium]|nr:peptidoglycan DD-metalloendopeptidase family protein [Clostridia bacterium]
MGKKLLISILILLFIGVQFFSTFAASINEYKEKRAEAEEELKDIKEEKSEVMEEVSKLTDEIANLEDEIDGVKNNITDIQNDIQQKESELQNKNNELKEKEDLLAKRLVAMYIAGDTTYLDFILSGNLIDFMSNYYLVSQIAEYDQDLIREVEKQKESINEQKNSLEQEKQKLEEQKANLYNKNNKLESNKTKKQQTVSSLNEEQKKVQSEIDKYYAAQKQLEEEMRRVERERDAKEKNKQGSSSNLVFKGSTFKWPCPASSKITSYFGYREQPVPGASTYHKGIDIGASTGTAIVAAADGEVVTSSYSGSAGNYVMINHGSGVYTVYMHASRLIASVGQSVKAGQTIALVGSTGYSSGPHLHFGVRINGSYVNPMNYFSK